MGIFSLKKSAIKSIQRGSVSVAGVGSVVVAISDVNPSKCVLSVYGTGKIQNSSGFTTRTFQVNLTASNQITVTSNNFGIADNTGTATWQVVEYY
jgi:hypothetical protein